MLTEARKKANEKWRKAHLEYFNDWVKNKYRTDADYRERCKQNVKNYRAMKKQIKELMMIQMEV